MLDDTKNTPVRVRFLLPVEIAGHKHPANSYEADVTEAEAAALEDAGRAKRVQVEQVKPPAAPAALPTSSPNPVTPPAAQP